VAKPPLEDAERMSRDILAVLPQVVAVLPPDEVEAALSDLPPMKYTLPLGGHMRGLLSLILIISHTRG